MDIFPIAEVVAATGVTSRTLRHYEQIGLLKPSGKAPGGKRKYSTADLLRLQNILVLKGLGMDLATIGEVLDGNVDPVLAVQRQLDLVKGQIKRFERIKDALEITQIRIVEGEPIVPNESFDGFNNDEYAAEAQQRWPDNFAESQKRMAKLSLQEQRAIFAQHGEIAVALTMLMAEGKSPTDELVQAEIAKHYRWICNFWTPDLAAYVALGQMYVDDERFAATYNSFGEGLAEFIRRGILHYAASNLA